ncbi:SDR family oxidoreductase [Nitriliruptor alkaliphilus]|uniref:SDR family oxidoreductase n=1 Tax=Nitriliruptor alkaliphilus TaxID=427918 RepID=UPI000695AC49|nr:SDR family oxidoreductase [Nitriliruptor alkaliphilus]
MTARLLESKPAIVTGGGTGIGLAIAARLVELGAQVAITSRAEEHLEEGGRLLRERTGSDVLTVASNVRDPDSVSAMVDRVATQLGSPTILVNNAAANFVCRAEALSPNGWRAIQETVLWGTWFCSTAVAPHMFNAGGGVICNILSTVAISGAAGRSHSASAKAGVASLTKSLGVEWADRAVRVVAVAPGPVDTPGSRQSVWGDGADDISSHLPMQRMADPAEIARAVGFLCSPDASYVNGETLVVDGGAWLAGATYGPGLQDEPNRSKS